MNSTLKLMIVATVAITAAGSAFAHPHTVEKNGQVLANGANHPPFLLDANGNRKSCEASPQRNNNAAWYGLETAHHGPDASGGGRSDGCYQIEGNLSPLNPAADRNPAIK